MNDWEMKQIKNLGRIVTGKTPPTENSEYFDGEELFVSPKDLDWDSHYITETETHITSKALEKFKNQVIPRNTVMFTSLSFAFGKMGIASRLCLTNQQINSVIVNRENNPKFVYYLLQAYKPIIFSYNSGIDTPIVPKSVFEKIEVKIPPKKLQEKIAAILSAYDELIENNQRRIALLEKMAEEIYREWFVRLRFPGHEKVNKVKGVPEGWAVSKISDVVDFLSGFSFESETYTPNGKYGVVTIKNVQDGYFIPECSDFVEDVPSKMKKHCFLEASDVLMSLTGNVGRVCHVYGDNLVLNQRVAKLLPKFSNSSQYLFCLFNNKSMTQLIENLSLGSTAQMNLSPILLGKQKIVIPSDNLLLKFERTIQPMHQEKMLLLQKNKLLAKLRDKLLPRLISGKLSVEHLDIQFPPGMEESVHDI